MTDMQDMGADDPTETEWLAARGGSTPPSYTEDEVEQVRQVLAENGYPNPSPEDIQQVLRHVQLYLHAGDSAAASERDAVPSTCTPNATAVEPAVEVVERISHPQPSRRFALHTRPALPAAAWDSSTQVDHPPVHGPHFPSSRSPPRRHTGTARELLHTIPPTSRLERHVRRHARALADALTHDPDGGKAMTHAASARGRFHNGANPAAVFADRRSANVIFNVTGDRRYRFRPTVAAAANEATIVTARACKGMYNPQSSCRHRGQALSPYSVSYLRADGSTLSAKTDPVARGAHMRQLWSRDPFLTQRGREAEVWHTRQAMMSVDSGAACTQP